MVAFARSSLDMKKVDLILPVPLHRVKQRQRQFNQANLLAKALSCAFTKPVLDKQLMRIKSGPAQVNLSQAQRLKNVQDAFKVKNARLVNNKNILLVDDVFTTGATVNECAKVLVRAGANRVDVLSLARS